MASGRKAMLQFMRALEGAPVGTPFEVGDTWTQLRGWRPYQRIGEKMLIVSPDQARALCTIYEKMGADPQWAEAWASMKGTFKELRAAADECDRKNRERVVPPDAAAAMQSEGRA